MTCLKTIAEYVQRLRIVLLSCGEHWSLYAFLNLGLKLGQVTHSGLVMAVISKLSCMAMSKPKRMYLPREGSRPIWQPVGERGIWLLERPVVPGTKGPGGDLVQPHEAFSGQIWVDETCKKDARQNSDHFSRSEQSQIWKKWSCQVCVVGLLTKVLRC